MKCHCEFSLVCVKPDLKGNSWQEDENGRDNFLGSSVTGEILGWAGQLDWGEDWAQMGAGWRGRRGVCEGF